MQAIWQSKYVRILTILLLAQATLFYTASHGDSRPLAKPLKEFPATLPGWKLVGQGVVEKETMDVLRADDVLSRFYLRSSAPEIGQLTHDAQVAAIASSEELFIAYFSTQ